MSNFFQDCATLLDTLYELQQLGVKETASEESAFMAEYVLKELQILQLGDAFLFASAINTLSAFAGENEENRNRIGEGYKTAAGELCRYLSEQPECGMAIELHEENRKAVMYTEICQIQFSCGRVPLDERTSPFYVPEPEDQKLIPDKLYEQKLSETILSFALHNTKLCEGLTTDGKNFTAMLEHALELYRSGKLRLEDLLDHDQQLADLGSQLTAFFEQTNVVLCETGYSSFHRALTERTLMPFIAQNFEQLLGYPMSTALYGQGKYALETIRALMAEWGRVSPEIRVQTGYMRTPTDEHFYLLFSSTVNEVPGCAVIQLYGWESMEAAESDGIIRFRYHGQPDASETFHPGLQGVLLYEYLKLGCYYDWNHIRMGSFLYETAGKPSVETSLEQFSNGCLSQPLYYAPEGMELLDRMSEVLTGGPVSEQLLEERQEKTSGGLLDQEKDLELLIQALRAGLETERTALFVISWRMSADMAAVRAIFSEAFCTLSEGKTEISTEEGMEIPKDTQILVHLGYFPSSMDFARVLHQVVVLDWVPSASQAKESFLMTAEELRLQGVAIHAFTFGSALGYSDAGAGFDRLVKLLHLTVPRNQIWDRSLYPIIISDRQSTEAKEGIAQLTIPSSITSERIHQQEWREAAERESLYHALRNGIRGISLMVEDPALRDELQQALDAYSESLSRIFTEIGADVQEEDKSLSTHGSAAENRAREDAMKMLGSYAWRMLHEESRDWVVSALVSYSDLMRVGQFLDYSGVNLLISKAFEKEGQCYLAEGYLDYMRRKYGDAYLEMLPEEMVSHGKDGALSAVETDHITIGSFPFIMGFGLNSKIASQTDYEHFAAYADEVLLCDKNDIYAQLQSLAEILNRVCLRYRDTAAHSVATDAQTATECVNYCVLEERKLGVMMDLFRKMEMQH